MRSTLNRHRAAGLVMAMTTALATFTGIGQASASPRTVSTSPVAVPGISAPADVVVGEADGSVTLPVTLGAPGESKVTVNYATADGTGNGDYAACELNNSSFVNQSGTLTFLPGVTTQDVTVKLLNCGESLTSGFETFSFKLSGNSTGSTIVRAASQVDITGDAPASATPGLYVRDAVVDTTAGTVKVPVVLGGPSGAAESVTVTVPYTTNNGSAAAGTDYSATHGTLTFAPGQTAQNITVPIIDRTGTAPTRSFSVTLGTPTNATVADRTGVVTIGASGATPVPLPGISAPADVVVGQVDGYLDEPVTLSAPGESTVTVNYTTADGTGNGDYQACELANTGFVNQSGTLTFVPGVTTQVVRVPVLNCGESLMSGFETFSFKLSGNSTGSTIVRAASQVDITGDAPASATPGLYVRDAVVDTTAGTVKVPVVLGGPSGAAESVTVTVPYTTNSGSAAAGTDYSATHGTLTFAPGQTAQNITVPIIDRTGTAPTRSFSVTLGTPTNATVADRTGVVTIGTSGATPVPLPGISAPADVVVGQVDGYLDEPVTLSAPGESTVTVNYTTADGTGNGDYQACELANTGFVNQSGTLTFVPGVTTQVVRVPVLNCGESLMSGFETFSFKLSGNSTGSTIVRAASQVDITGDAPASATPGLYVRDAVVDTTAGTVKVPVVLGGPSGAAESVTVTVPYTTNNGSAAAGTDYSATHGTLTFAPGQTAQNITVPIIDRTGTAPTRSFSVTLGTPTNATVADRTGVVTIGASGAKAVPAPKISASANAMVYRGSGYIDLPVTLSAPGKSTVTVNYATADGTGNGDYQACELTSSSFVNQSGTLTFVPGVTTQVVRVTVLNCGQTVKTTFSLALSGNSSGSSIARTDTTVTVVPKVTVPGAPTSVVAVAGAGQATVSFAAPASDGGDAVNSYTVTATPGGAHASGISSPLVVTGLTSGTAYTFTVTATNSKGTGSASLPSNAVTPS